MKKFGGYLLFFGLFAMVLSFMDRVPKLLVWIYNWGETTAWIIMAGMTLAGAALYLLTPKDPQEIQETPAEVQEEVKE